MKHFSLSTLRCLVAIGMLGLLAHATATAQRTDSLMTKVADVIVPYNGATSVNGFLYYLADDGKTGYELWRTDGTKTGTTLVKDIRPGKSSAFISDSTNYYYADYNSSTYTYSINSQKLKNSLRAFQPYVLNSVLYFWADDGVSGIELWRSDGTEAGTRMVVDLIPGPISTGNQYDILIGNGGYLGGVNGGYTNGNYYSTHFATNQGKLIFWSYNVNNVVWETNGTSSGTREINVQSTKYRSVTGTPIIVNGRTFISTNLYDKGKYYYSLLQDNGTTTATSLLVNSPDYPYVLLADKRGVVYGTPKADTKQTTYSIFRRDSLTAKTALLKQITIPRSTTLNSYQGVTSIGQTTNEVWLRAYDQPSAAGKGSDEIWRFDLATDSVQRVKRYDYSQVTVSSQTRLEKGSEAFYTNYSVSGTMLLTDRIADSTSTYDGNRYRFQYYDAKTGKLQVSQDSLMYGYSLQTLGADGKPGTGGKALVVGRGTAKDAYKVWLTDGRTKKTLKTLGTYENAPYFNSTDIGLVGVGYNTNYDKNKKATGYYKVDTWKYDTTAAGTVLLGQRANNPGGVGTLVASGGNLYGLYYTLLKLSSAAPDTIRPVADFYNFGSEVLSYQANSEYTSNLLGIINGRAIGKPRYGDNLLAIDPSAAPRKCTIALTSVTKAATSYNTKDLGYCPARDSVVTLRNNVQLMSSGTGEVSRIYYKTYTWLRDSTVLQTGTADSLKLRQQGQYALTLRGVADGCVTNDTWKVFYNTPTVSQIPKLSNDNNRKTLVAVITGGYPINGTAGYYSGKWERTTADGAVSQASTGTDFNASSIYRTPATIALDEAVGTAYQPRYGTYTLKVTDANSCSATGTYVYDDKTTILGITTNFSARNGADLCAGTPVSYTVAATGGKAPYTYRWLRSGVPTADVLGATGTIPINSDLLLTDYTGNFSIEVTDADGKKTYSNEAGYFVKAGPAVSLTATGNAVSAAKSVTLTATCSNYQYPTFAWAKDGAVVAGVAGKSLTATTAGLYSVTVGSGTALGCTTKATLPLTAGSGRQAAAEPVLPMQTTAERVNNQLYKTPASAPMETLSTLKLDDKPGLRIMPNPTEGPMRVHLPLPQAIPSRGRILNSQGQVIQQWDEPTPKPAVDAVIDLSPQPTGMYIIQVEAGGTVHSQKVIKR